LNDFRKNQNREATMNIVFAALAWFAILVCQAEARHEQERRLAEYGLAADVPEIVKVVRGRTCVNAEGDVLRFGKEESPTFDHTGHASATYRLGYSSLIILRGGDLHSHLVTVSPSKRLLYFATGTYRC